MNGFKSLIPAFSFFWMLIVEIIEENSVFPTIYKPNHQKSSVGVKYLSLVSKVVINRV